MRPMICYFIIRPRVGKERNGGENKERGERSATENEVRRKRSIDRTIRAFQIFRPSARCLLFELPTEEKKRRGDLTARFHGFVKKERKKKRRREPIQKLSKNTRTGSNNIFDFIDIPRYTPGNESITNAYICNFERTKYIR